MEEVNIYQGTGSEWVRMVQEELDEVNASIEELRKGEPLSPAVLAVIAAELDISGASGSRVPQKRKLVSRTTVSVPSLSRMHSY